MLDNIILLGVFFLGGFVGFILALALNFPKSLNLKVISTIISTVLGGTPVAFMSGLTYEKWMYPIGLVTGLLWFRLISARTQAIYGGNPRLRAFAWIDILVIVGFTIVVIICAAFVK